MSIANTDINRRPTHPGEMLREDFLFEKKGLSICEWIRVRVNRFKNGSMRHKKKKSHKRSGILQKKDVRVSMLESLFTKEKLIPSLPPKIW